MQQLRSILFGAAVFLAMVAGAQAQQSSTASALQVLQIRDNVYVIVGGGGNTVVQTGEQGILVVNTKTAGVADDLVKTVRSLVEPATGFLVTTHSHPALEGSAYEQRMIRGGPNDAIRVVVNTDSDVDQMGGNAAIAAAGGQIAGGNVTFDIADAKLGAAIYAHENTLLRVSGAYGGEPSLPSESWPTNTFFGQQKAIYFNNEAVRMYHQAAAQTDGDLIVFLRRSDVIVTGDLYDTESYPKIDLAKGGTINGVIGALNHIIDLCTPAFGQEGGTLVIPGHGRVSSYGDVVNYRDMVTIIRDRIQDMIKRGKSLKEVKAARVTMDYDPVFGSDNGAWTTEKFIEAAYASLKPKK
jgi:cyclase